MNWNNDSLYDTLPVTMAYAKVLARVVKRMPSLKRTPYQFVSSCKENTRYEGPRSSTIFEVDRLFGQNQAESSESPTYITAEHISCQN